MVPHRVEHVNGMLQEGARARNRRGAAGVLLPVPGLSRTERRITPVQFGPRPCVPVQPRFRAGKPGCNFVARQVQPEAGTVVVETYSARAHARKKAVEVQRSCPPRRQRQAEQAGEAVFALPQTRNAPSLTG